jgi:predicted ATPase/signal transduction histidine kinase
VSDRFLIPDILYGRDTEVAALASAFDRIAQHGLDEAGDVAPAPCPAELLLVTGFSGIGKTAVVKEVHKPIVQRRGYFIKGKYDQFQRNIPFLALVQALRDLMGQVLGESDRQLAQWGDRIQAALGDNGQVMIDVVPELEQIIGKQPPVPVLTGLAAQHRFNLVFQQFIGALAANDHPLVMFIDDLQWADSASLTVIQQLLSEAQIGHLLLIGAYRDNEVPPGHPLMLMLEELDPSIVQTVTLHPLQPEDVNQMVAATLSCPVDLAKPLAQLVYAKTQGNPFFANQFLKALHDEQLIRFNPEAGVWECDLAAIKPRAMREDVAEFMAQQLQKLPTETQMVLKLAACVGNQFDLETLAIVVDQSPTQTAIALWHALRAELVLPSNDIYKFYQDEEEDGLDPTDAHPLQYCFLHDRVQQAAYGLIAPEEKDATHLTIGQRLQQHLSPDQQDHYLFTIANQLNQGRRLIVEVADLDDLATLNRRVSVQAKKSTAYQAALEYAKVGIQCLLPSHDAESSTTLGDAVPSGWQRQYALLRSLHEIATETAYLVGDLDTMERYANAVLSRAPDLLDKIEVYNVKILAYTAINDPVASVDLGLTLLRQLGVNLPDSPTGDDIQQTLTDVAQLHPKEGIASLLAQPEMNNRQARAALQILNAIFTPCYAIAPMMIPLISATGAKLSMMHGCAPLSVIAYAGYGMLLCGISNNIAAGYEFGQLALNLLPRFSESAIQTRVMCMVSAFVLHWRRPLTATISTLQTAFQRGVETGDLQYTAWSYYHDCQGSYLAGQELISLERKLTRYEHALAQLKQEFQRDRSLMLHQVVLNLMHPTPAPCDIVGLIYDEAVTCPQYEASNNTEALFFIYFHRMLLHYWFGEPDAAWDAAQVAEGYLTSVPAQAVVPVFYFYDALIHLACYPHLTSPDQDQILTRVHHHYERLDHWAEFAPHTYRHKCQLIVAERAQVLGQTAIAIDAYDEAIAQAHTEGFLQEEALANERAAIFYLHRGKERVAAGYMQDAYYGYARWGAKTKTDHLIEHYGYLLRPIVKKEPTRRRQPSTEDTLPLTAADSAGGSSLGILNTTQSPRLDVNNILDFGAMLKASQAISSTLDRNELLTQLTQTLLFNSGGDRCVIILCSSEPPSTAGQESDLQVGAIASLNQTQVLDSALEETEGVPIQLIQYVKNTAKTVVIDSATSQIPVADCYLMEQNIASVLCLPLIDKTYLRGVLYLENRATTGVFHEERLAAVHLLATQAAIALENARLYHKAQTYAKQLEDSQVQLVQSEKMSALGNLVAGVAHEINNPLGFVDGNLEYLQNTLPELLRYLEDLERAIPSLSEELTQKRNALDIEFLLEDLPSVVTSMQSGCDRLRDISSSLRNFSRTQTTSRFKADIHESIDSTLLILKYRLKDSDIRPAIDIIKDYGDLPNIYCYPGPLNQVFMNIFANAIDMFDEMADTHAFEYFYTHPQRITIRTRQLDSTHIAIHIRDNGRGMTDEICGKIFDRTFTTKEVGKGTGLGMAIARQIVEEDHGGHLTVESHPGQGTEFSLILPIMAESDFSENDLRKNE